MRAQQLLGRPIDVAVDVSEYEGAILDTDEQPLTLDQIPGMRAFRGEKLEGVELRLRRPDGRVVPILVNAAPIPGTPDSPRTAVVALEDISALKEVERLRMEWSALIAHDLRQPLNGIGLYAQALARETSASPLLHRRVLQIRVLSQRLNRMIQDLLDFTRLEARQLTLDRRNFDLIEIIREVTERISLDAPDRPIEVNVHGGPAVVHADSDRLAQVMDNLLTNAVKYGDPGSPIHVHVDATGDAVTLSVTNRGPGISPENMPHLFTRFQRACDTQRRGAKGIGLGLYITRELIEAHQGRIAAESVPGESTTFRFTLPRAEQPPPAGHG